MEALIYVEPVNFFHGNEDATFFNRKLCYICQTQNRPTCILVNCVMRDRLLYVLQQAVL